MTLAITNALGTIHSSFSCLPPFSLLLPPSSPLNSAGWLTGLLRALVAGRIKRWYKKRLKGHRKQWLLKGGVGGGWWWWWQEQSTAPRASSNSQSGGAASGHLSLCIICRRWSILWWPWGQGRGTIGSKRRWYSPKQRLENYPSASAAINKLQSLFFFTWLFAQVALFYCEITALFPGWRLGVRGVGNIWKQQKIFICWKHCNKMHILFGNCVFHPLFFKCKKKKKKLTCWSTDVRRLQSQGKKVLTRWPEHQMAFFSSRRWSPSYVITSIAHTCKVPCWNRWQTWQTAHSSPIRSLNVSVAGGQEM